MLVGGERTGARLVERQHADLGAVRHQRVGEHGADAVLGRQRGERRPPAERGQRRARGSWTDRPVRNASGQGPSPTVNCDSSSAPDGGARGAQRTADARAHDGDRRRPTTTRNSAHTSHQPLTGERDMPRANATARRARRFGGHAVDGEPGCARRSIESPPFGVRARTRWCERCRRGSGDRKPTVTLPALTDSRPGLIADPIRAARRFPVAAVGRAGRRAARDGRGFTIARSASTRPDDPVDLGCIASHHRPSPSIDDLGRRGVSVSSPSRRCGQPGSRRSNHNRCPSSPFAPGVGARRRSCPPGTASRVLALVDQCGVRPALAGLPHPSA